MHHKLATKKPDKVIKNCKSCGTVVVRAPSAISKSGNVYCRVCKKPKGEDHGKWAEGQYINKDGYRMILKNGSYQREHRVVWQEVNKACLLSTGTIHHVDYEKLNNSPDNLLLLSDEEHGRFHRLAQYRSDEAGEILRAAGLSQLYYPRNIDAWILRNYKA